MLQDVVAFVWPPVAAFELGVVAEVFGLDRSADGLPRFRFAVASTASGVLPTSSGFGVHVDHGLGRLASADLVAIPSWPTDGTPPPAALADALHAAVDRGARVLGICSGAFLLAAVGLLDGRRAATHWRYAQRLADLYPAVRVDPAVLYVDEGTVVTTAGTAAAIDACLHLVRTEYGSAVASAIARRMVVAAHRSGGQAQFVDHPVPAARDDGLAAALDWALARLEQHITVADLASQVHMSSRTFWRRFKQSTGTTPHQWLVDQRLLRAQALLEDTDMKVDVVARLAGFGSADALRHQYAARRGISPIAHRRAFRGGR